MNTKTTLSGLLAIQLIIIAGLWWHAQNQSNNNLPQPLLDIRWENVDKVTITSETGTVSLGLGQSKDDGEWQLLEDGLLAQNDKVNALLEKLEQLQVKWPVATNQTSHSRFEVDQKNAQRRIAIYSGENLLGEILIGSSPGLKQLHIRKVGSDQVYVVELELADIPPKTTDWLDRSLLAAKNVNRIEGANFVLAKTGNNWQLSRKGPSILINQDGPVVKNQQKIEDLLSSLNKLRVTGLVKDKPDLAEGHAVRLDVTSGDNSWRYTFHEHNGQHFVQRSDRDTLFTFSKSDYEEIAQSSQLIVDSQEEQKVED
ncbi:DUF4340 domain-containing protein [uncultured Porticoccus sp.]|uniref:DUF4340 domain-containing protein n=1 Tax=uncultured Porticoccus sp. TaxID=1256050 RepID=UPI0030DB3978|tara:strand:- start:745 stop:1683 length:939 start_codon:yes stop_codon:yes gene_type:complete